MGKYRGRITAAMRGLGSEPIKFADKLMHD